PPSGDPDVTFFDVTAHNVPEPFATYWETRGGLARFGYPLTEAFPEQSVVDGVTYLTQYFERARFEYHPEYAGSEYEVLLGLLGVERTGSRVSEYPFRPVGPDQTPDGGAHFPETGHTLSGNFLDFWLENGGLPIFGYPISERFEEVSETDGELHVVQYFERNRFEYHPNLPQLPNGVLLGHLAREALLDRGWLPRTLSSASDD
ncbi:MAG: N-acetylmuramoyl-L-alanine amidase, partial [Chloroflexia bacterium]|nr:N-acetylmuramoyl-L-alanine amidase [Chloroflexia bacterium]